MKKLLIASLVSVLAMGSAYGFWGCGGCGCIEKCEREEAPVCKKMVEKTARAKKVCEKQCHWECPDGYEEK